MEKTVVIEGLNCPNCARTLARELNKLKEVESVQINFDKKELVFEAKDVEKALKNIVKCAKKVKPNAKITDRDE